jgi:hypothetical protein
VSQELNNNNTSIVKLLLDVDNIDVNIGDLNPLGNSCEYDSDKIAKLLLTHKNIDVNKTTIIDVYIKKLQKKLRNLESENEIEENSIKIDESNYDGMNNAFNIKYSTVISKHPSKIETFLNNNLNCDFELKTDLLGKKYLVVHKTNELNKTLNTKKYIFKKQYLTKIDKLYTFKFVL